MSSHVAPSLRTFSFLLGLLVALTLAITHVTGAQNNSNTNTANTNTANTNTANTNATTGNTNAGAGNVNAAAGATATPGSSPPPTPGPEPCARGKQVLTPKVPKPGAKLTDLKVVDVRRADTNSKAERNRAGLYNTICVEVQHLADWMLADQKNDPHKFILYIDTYPLPAVRARPEASGSDYLRFDLERTEDKRTQDNWRNILNRPKLIFPTARLVPITIGYDADPAQYDEAPINSTVSEFAFVDVNPKWFGVFAVVFVAALALFIMLARSSDLLRDSGPEPEGRDSKGKPNRRPFSLGRTQMAVWFFIVVACYVFIWMVTSNGNTITNTVLGLIGISAATALGSVFISDSKSSQAEEERTRLRAEEAELAVRVNELEGRQTQAEARLQELRAAIAALQAKSARTPGEEQELEAKKTQLSEVTASLSSAEADELRVKKDRRQKVRQLLAGASRGFFTDILSDAGGVSFHRFQIAAWTVTLSVIFLAQVFNYLMMPEFDATLLALMGISSGTYLGFKLPERQAQTT